MRHINYRLATTLATFVAVSVAPTAWAQNAGDYGVVTIDNVPYVLPEGAANNLDAARVLIKVADHAGMVRNVTRTVGGTVMSLEYRGTGTMGGESVSFVTTFDYRMPAIRLDVTHADKSRTVTVASGDKSWDESTPGVYLQPGKTSADERLMSLWLLPHFVIHEGADQAHAMKLATKDGMRELTIPVPRYQTELKALVNDQNEIVHTEMAVGGKLYSADFSDRQSDRMEYHVYFPHKIVEKVDGKTVADLTVESHVPGPYSPWAIPQALASK